MDHGWHVELDHFLEHRIPEPVGERWAGEMAAPRIRVEIATDETQFQHAAFKFCDADGQIGPGGLRQLTHPARITLLRRIGKTSGRVRITDGEGRHTSTEGNLDAALVGALLGAHQSLRGSQAGRSLGAEHLATEAAPKSPYQRNLARLAFLAPDIQKLILEGAPAGRRDVLAMSSTRSAPEPRGGPILFSEA